jgi:hypothetical protein
MFCTAGNREGVAESTEPAGPFTQATPIAGAEGDAIDPAVLVDDDGEGSYPTHELAVPQTVGHR